ncbi:MAG: hypothetical protein IPP29_16315 [Bacteroidetes bacterium]|nr:hypothetical protein [Bacteroidota bacterium]
MKYYKHDSCIEDWQAKAQIFCHPKNRNLKVTFVLHTLNHMEPEKEKKINKASEPQAGYELSNNKQIIFFNSFEESEEYNRKQMCEASYEQRLKNLEVLRSRRFILDRIQKLKLPMIKYLLSLKLSICDVQ